LDAWTWFRARRAIKAEIDEQGVRSGGHVIPDTISENLKSTNAVVYHEKREECAIRMRLQAEDEIRPRAWRIVAEPGIGVSLAAKLVNEIAVVKLQQLRHFWKQTVLHSRASCGELVQNIPA